MCQFNDPIQKIISVYRNTEIKIEEQNRCLVKEFFEAQRDLPKSQQIDYCYISCRCKNCNPGIL
jgi:hypothetical protein